MTYQNLLKERLATIDYNQLKEGVLNGKVKASYVQIQKEWRKLRPFFESEKARNIWEWQMREYLGWRAYECESNGGKFSIDWQHVHLAYPADCDSCDWRFDRETNLSRRPAYWDYVCHGASHDLVDLNLFVAKNAYPDVPWQILSSDSHSTVWNGSSTNPVLFDANFLALGVDPTKALKMALGRKNDGFVLHKGHYLNSSCLS